MDIWISLSAPEVEEPSLVGNFNRKSGDKTDQSKKADDAEAARAAVRAQQAGIKPADDEEEEETKPEQKFGKPAVFAETPLAGMSASELTARHDKLSQ